ncbi:DNA repair protein RecN [uncultured Paludibacter sp.]|nr:DNA repair protein RecN [uncultured Paludibacter sp.]
MLKSLHISNYALINELTIDFDNGFTVLTGETGAGKSIIIGALSLVLGQRADTKVIKEGEVKSVVEALFEIKNYNLQPFFEQNELDYTDVCTVRREITSNGKSRAFINDTPVSLIQLRDLTVHLLDIHSQHENLLLSTENYQLNFVDAVAQNQIELENYQKTYQKWLQEGKNLEKIRKEAEQQTADLDYLQFQFNQLNEANLQENEQKGLEEEQEMLMHVEEIKRELQQADFFLSSEEVNALKLIKDAASGLNRIQSYLTESGEWTERLESILLDLKDIVSEINKAENRMESNPERLNLVEERLSLLYSLQKKFKVENIEQLIELRETFKNRLNRIENYDDLLKEAEKAVVQAEKEMRDASKTLSETRRKISSSIETFLVEKLIALGIPDVRIKVSVEKSDVFNEKGNDIVQLLFSANKNRSLQPISEVASGGEISRVMLAVKSLLVHKSALPTIIFDEIDTGVSGEIASRVGEIMKFMSQDTQVVTITHLPQIAAKGTHHFKVYKDNAAENVTTYISKLSSLEREKEIAQLLSGQQITQAALQNAQELLKN